MLKTLLNRFSSVILFNLIVCSTFLLSLLYGLYISFFVYLWVFLFSLLVFFLYYFLFFVFFICFFCYFSLYFIVFVVFLLFLYSSLFFYFLFRAFFLFFLPMPAVSWPRSDEVGARSGIFYVIKKGGRGNYSICYAR